MCAILIPFLKLYHDFFYQYLMLTLEMVSLFANCHIINQVFLVYFILFYLFFVLLQRLLHNAVKNALYPILKLYSLVNSRCFS